MTRQLESYAAGRWFAADEEGRPLLDAGTGEEVARISSAGLDLGAMASYARNVGGPALRELTFHQRAALLKELGKHLKEHREELYALSLRTGATRGDGMFDVDGGIGVLLAYGSVGPGSCPTTRSTSTAARSRWARAERSSASTSSPAARRDGADQRVQLPGLGTAGEARPGVPGRVPSIVKPASQTAYLTAAW